MKRIWNKNISTPVAVLILGIGFLTLLFIWLTLIRYWTLLTDKDLVYYTQVLWKMAHGLPPTPTVEKYPHTFGCHFEPFLYLLAPIQKFFPGAVSLLVVQTLSAAAAIPFLFSIVRRRAGERAAAFWSFVFFLYPPLIYGLMYDFHPTLFAVPVSIFCLDALDQRKEKRFWIGFFVLLSIRENLGLLAAAFGFLFFLRKEFKKGFLALGLGFGWTIFAIKVVIPFFQGDAAYVHWSYNHMGRSPLEVVLFVLQHPWRAVEMLWDHSLKRESWMKTVFPLGGLFFLSPWWVLALPNGLERFWSSSEPIWNVRYHYGAPTSALLTAAAACGWFRAQRFFSKRFGNRRAAGIERVLIVFFVLNLVFWAAQTPLKVLQDPSGMFSATTNRDVDAFLQRQIPTGASVTADSRVAAHVACRKELYLFDEHAPLGDVVVYFNGYADARPFESIAEREYFIAVKAQKTHRRRQVGPWVFWERRE